MLLPLAGLPIVPQVVRKLLPGLDDTRLSDPPGAEVHWVERGGEGEILSRKRIDPWRPQLVVWGRAVLVRRLEQVLEMAVLPRAVGDDWPVDFTPQRRRE
jgi:hypothetical protein